MVVRSGRLLPSVIVGALVTGALALGAGVAGADEDVPRAVLLGIPTTGTMHGRRMSTTRSGLSSTLADRGLRAARPTAPPVDPVAHEREPAVHVAAVGNAVGDRRRRPHWRPLARGRRLGPTERTRARAAPGLRRRRAPVGRREHDPRADRRARPGRRPRALRRPGPRRPGQPAGARRLRARRPGRPVARAGLRHRRPPHAHGADRQPAADPHRRHPGLAGDDVERRPGDGARRPPERAGDAGGAGRADPLHARGLRPAPPGAASGPARRRSEVRAGDLRPRWRIPRSARFRHRRRPGAITAAPRRKIGLRGANAPLSGTHAPRTEISAPDAFRPKGAPHPSSRPKVPFAQTPPRPEHALTAPRRSPRARRGGA